MSKLQDNSFKSSAQAGGDDRLTSDDKVYVTANTLNKTLKETIEDGDMGSSSAIIVSNSTTGAIDGSAYANNTIVRHLANDTSTYTLPGATAGFRLLFIHEGVNNTSIANEMRIKAASGDEIAWQGKLSVNPGYLSVEKRGVAISLLALDTTTWEVERVVQIQHTKNSTIGFDKDVSVVGKDAWVTKAVLSATRRAASGFTLNFGYVCNGHSGGAVTNLVEQYNDNADSWSTKATGGTARMDCASFALNGYGYLAGGDTGARVTNVDQYNESANTWAAKTGLPSGKSGAGQPSGSLNGYGYAIGGDTGARTAEVNRYNDNLNSWTTMTSLGTVRAWHTSWALNGYIYSCDGYNASAVTNVVEQYNDSANAWIVKSTGGTARQGVAGFTLNNYGYICNGDSGANSNEVNQYNDSLNTWSTKATAGTARQYPAGFGTNGYGYVCGGTTGSNSSEVNQYN